MSRTVNKVMLIGNCAAEPEVKITSNSNKMVTISIATNDSRPDGKGGFTESTEWHRINFWGKLADVAQAYLHKGTKVYVEGRLSSYTYQDKNHPEVTQRSYNINADNMIMLSSRQDNNGGYNSSNYNNSYGGSSNWGNSSDSGMNGGGYNSFNGNSSSYGNQPSNQSQNFGGGFSQPTAPMAPQGNVGGYNNFNTFNNNQGSSFNNQNTGFNNQNSGFNNNQNNRGMNNGGYNGGNTGGNEDVPF